MCSIFDVSKLVQRRIVELDNFLGYECGLPDSVKQSSSARFLLWQLLNETVSIGELKLEIQRMNEPVREHVDSREGWTHQEEREYNDILDHQQEIADAARDAE